MSSMRKALGSVAWFILLIIINLITRRMDQKSGFYSHKLSLAKIKKKSPFYSEDDGSADTPNTNMSNRRVEFQTDDSDSGTPLSKGISKQSPSAAKSSKFKQQAQQGPEPRSAKPHLTQTGRLIVANRNIKHIYSDAELKNQRAPKNKIINHPFRQLIFGDHVDEDVFQKHLLITQRGLIYATKCLKGPSEKFLKSKEVDVPVDDQRKKVLILDLDETLVHSCQGKEKPQVVIKTPDDQEIGINLRPHVSYFLESLSTFYSIFIFTASSPGYATTIVDYLDPEQSKILGILTRNHCMETKNGFFIKDLRILKDINLKDMVMVDNLSHSFGLQIDNGVPILEWRDDPKDQELKFLVDYLVEASTYDDMREFNRKKLRLRELIDFNLEEAQM